uniref:Solute carrier family 40 member n=1 Tax=Leersia perrieri TaxID=77586 RepID=A0A0D9WCD5_9ORYZ
MPAVSKLLSPPPRPRLAVIQNSGRRVAPLHLPFILPPGNSIRRSTSHPRLLCSSSSSDHAASTSSTAIAGAGDEESLPFVQLSSTIFLRTVDQSLLGDDTPSPESASVAGVQLKGGRGEDSHLGLGETPAYPAAMNALYAACLAGNATEQLWNFTWPAAVAVLHPSTLLPVALLGLFTKLVVFVAGPLVGEVITSLPRIPAYRSLAAIQTAAHLVSAATITYAFAVHSSPAPAPPQMVLLRPWFAVLVASTAVDRLSCVALGIIAERDFVVQLAGEGRPVALAKANATLSRVDLLCETVGASIFAFLLSKNDPLTCIKLSSVISLCALPLLIFLGGEMNRLADGIFDQSQDTMLHTAAPNFSSNITKTVEEAMATIRHGWIEYLQQPVLPASLAYVLVCFNVALAPGALMTTFLIHQGVSPSVIGAFGGSSAAVGILSTFVTARLVRELGILKAGAAGLIAQCSLLGAAVVVYLSGAAVSRRSSALFVFLGLIVASRAGQMAYNAIGLQVVQTGNPASKAKLIGATEIAVASLAELAMMAVAVVARDASHFGALAALSAAAVAVAAGMYCFWLVNPTDEIRRLFPS